MLEFGGAGDEVKPLRLKLTAFGPYASHAVVDFRRLAAGGLFLIHGPTGAGKTSILDGICFSLYGSSSGSERKGEGMRCQLAQPDLATEASLEFLLGQQLYRVVRRPEQELNKKRGSGTTVSKAFGELFIWEGFAPAASAPQAWREFDLDQDENLWKPLATGASKVLDKVISLLGMDDEQFRQVVVLPQGQFRKFLASNSSDRERILETLFRTQRFRAAMEQLSGDSKLLEEAHRTKRQLLDGQLQSLEVKSCLELDEKRAALELEQSESLTAHESLERRHQLLREQLSHVKTWQKLQLELAHLSDARGLLEHEVPIVSELHRRLDLHQLTQSIFEIEARRKAAEDESFALSAKIREEDGGLRDLEIAMAALAREDVELQSRKPEMDLADLERAKLLEQHALANQLAELNRRIHELRAQRIQHESALKDLDASLLRSKSLATENQKRLAVETALGATVPQLTSEQRLLEVEAANLAEATQLLSLLERFDIERRKIEVHAQKLEGELILERRLQLEKQRDFHHSMAGRLARELQPDAPCPVCGSVTHPQPADLPASAPTQVELDEGAAALQLQEKNLHGLSQRLIKAQSEISSRMDELARRLSSGVASDPLDTLPAPLERFRERHRSLQVELEQKCAAKLAALHRAEESEKLAQVLKKTIEVENSAVEQLERQRREKERLSDEARAQFATLDQQREGLEKNLPVDRRDLNEIVKLGKSLRDKLDKFNSDLDQLRLKSESNSVQLGSIKSRIEILRSEEAKKRVDVTTHLESRSAALAASHFTDMQACESAHLDETARREFAARIRKHQEGLAVVSAQIVKIEADLAQLEPHQPRQLAENLGALEAEFQTAESTRADRLAKSGAVASSIQSMLRARTRLQELELEMQKLEARYSILGRLASVAAGRPPHNLSGVNFSRYVLSAQLDEVLEQASRRLMLMSQGQFMLRRVRNREDRRLTAGLDLEVEDSFTGTARPAAYLSGGESFLASLALALGLADVVQSYLGGVRLDAVFVDEGFGSLDSDALERAMRTLSDLRSGGRLVGIISHVPELKEQIRDRLFVRKALNGSRIDWEE